MRISSAFAFLPMTEGLALTASKEDLIKRFKNLCKDNRGKRYKITLKGWLRNYDEIGTVLGLEDVTSPWRSDGCKFGIEKVFRLSNIVSMDQPEPSKDAKEKCAVENLTVYELILAGETECTFFRKDNSAPLSVLFTVKLHRTLPLVMDHLHKAYCSKFIDGFEVKSADAGKCVYAFPSWTDTFDVSTAGIQQSVVADSAREYVERNCPGDICTFPTSLGHIKFVKSSIMADGSLNAENLAIAQAMAEKCILAANGKHLTFTSASTTGCNFDKSGLTVTLDFTQDASPAAVLQAVTDAAAVPVASAEDIARCTVAGQTEYEFVRVEDSECVFKGVRSGSTWRIPLTDGSTLTLEQLNSHFCSNFKGSFDVESATAEECEFSIPSLTGTFKVPTLQMKSLGSDGEWAAVRKGAAAHVSGKYCTADVCTFDTDTIKLVKKSIIEQSGFSVASFNLAKNLAEKCSAVPGVTFISASISSCNFQQEGKAFEVTLGKDATPDAVSEAVTSAAHCAVEENQFYKLVGASETHCNFQRVENNYVVSFENKEGLSLSLEKLNEKFCSIFQGGFVVASARYEQCEFSIPDVTDLTIGVSTDKIDTLKVNGAAAQYVENKCPESVCTFQTSSGEIKLEKDSIIVHGSFDISQFLLAKKLAEMCKAADPKGLTFTSASTYVCYFLNEGGEKLQASFLKVANLLTPQEVQTGVDGAYKKEPQ